jgi:hypothetical protein
LFSPSPQSSPQRGEEVEEKGERVRHVLSIAEVLSVVLSIVLSIVEGVRGLTVPYP